MVIKILISNQVTARKENTNQEKINQTKRTCMIIFFFILISHILSLKRSANINSIDQFTLFIISFLHQYAIHSITNLHHC